jgi:signal peptidase II
MESTQNPIGSKLLHKYTLLATLLPLLILLDQWTKYLIHTRLRLYEAIPIIEGFFNITYVRNTGAAFGMLADADPAFRKPFFIIVPLVALVSILLLLKRLPAHQNKTNIPLILILAGALGNLIDRFVYGFVVDFLSFFHADIGQFPAFNVADSAISVGVAFLMLEMFRNPNALEPPAAASK